MLEQKPMFPETPAAVAVATLPVQATSRAPASLDMDFGLAPPILLVTPIAHHLLAFARQKVTEGKYQITLVLDHVRCEWPTEWALESLIRLKGAEVMGGVAMALIGNCSSLSEHRIRKLYGTLTDDYPADDSDLRAASALWWYE